MDDKVVISFIGKDEVTPVAKKVEKSVEDTGKSAERASGGVGKMTSSTNDLGSALSGIKKAAALGAILSIGKQAFDASVDAALFYDKMENVRKSMGNLLDSKEAGDALYQTMKDIAARTPFTFTDVAESTQKLLAMGIAAEKIPATFDAIGNAASATGMGAEGVSRITLALGQMQAKGKITTEEMMQLQELGIPAFQLLADASGVSQQALMDMVSKGIIPANQNLDTLINAMNQNYGGAMAQSLGTATQAQSNFNDALDDAKVKLGEAVSPTLIGFYLMATRAVNGFTGALLNNNGVLGMNRAQQQQYIEGMKEDADLMAMYGADAGGFGLFLQQATIEGTEAMLGVAEGFHSYTNGAASAAQAGDTLTKSIRGTNAEAGKTPLLINAATTSTNGKSDADKEASQAQKELEKNTKEYEDTLKSLRGSYMDIADAQRSVESAERDLADAMDPLKIQQMTLSIQSQSIEMRDLNASMDEMKARRAEIARALASQNTEQIKHNALTAEEHRQLNGLNKSLGSLKKERDAIRKALQSGNLTDEQRVEFLRTEQALNAAINQQTGEKKTLEEKQNAAVKKAAEDRLKLIEEDKRLQADLEKSQIRAKQAIIDMQLAQKALAEAQDPQRLEAYKDAVTKAQTNLATLRLEQEQDKITADALAASIGVTSGATDALRQSALDTATPLDDLNTSSTNLNTTLSRPLGVNQSVTTTGDAIKGVSTYAASASTSLVGFNTVLGKLPDVKTKVDPLNDVATAMERIAALAPNFGSGMYDAVSQIKNAINGITGDGSSRWNSFSINFSAALKNATPSAIKNLVEALDAVNTAPGDLVSYTKKAQLTEAIGLYAKDNRLTRGEYEALTVGATGAEKAFIDAVIKSYGDKLKIDSDVPGVGTLFGIKPKSRLSLMNGMGMTLNTSTGSNGGTLQGSTTDANGNVQNITINLNYATPPESNDPLGDVKRYLAAQGGRLRI